MTRKSSRILTRAAEVLRIEIEGLEEVLRNIDGRFVEAVDMVLGCGGTVFLTGMGKAGIVGRKIASTFSSTGTPAVSMNPAEAVHGDVGMVRREDVVIAISNSGETEEVLKIIPIVKKAGARVISITGDAGSRIASMSDISLNCRVLREACPMGLAPTASSTAALALGDAIAMAVLGERGFKKVDFARSHPAGDLGRRASCKG